MTPDSYPPWSTFKYYMTRHVRDDIGKDLQQRKYVKMTTRPVDRLVRQLLAPTVVTMLITSLYNLVDTFFVGRLGPSATGAVGTIFSMMAVIQAIGFGFGHGAGNYVSRKLGERQVQEASTMATVGFVSSFALGLLVLILGLLFLDPLVDLLGVTLTIRPYAIDYLRYILLGAPFFASSLTLNNLLRLQGNANIAMVGIIAGAVLNCAMDPLFIFGLDMGIRGAGLSTFISQVVSLVILIIGTERCDAVKLRPCYFAPTRQRYIAIAQGGLPSLGRQSARSLSSILLNHAMTLFGDEVYAAITIVIRLANLIFAVAVGVGQGFQPVCGFNWGARLYQRVLGAYRYAQHLSTIILMVLSALLFAFAPLVCGWFSDNQRVVQLASLAMRAQCLSIPFMGFANICSMLFQNVNKYWPAFATAIGRDGLFFIPAVLLLPRLLGIPGIILTQPVADICTFLLAICLVRPFIRKVKAMACMTAPDGLKNTISPNNLR